ncbi:testis-specific zinc finger protein topi-like isoform X2 [Pecten maximus]|uniref:testis-specific zinc finger protein topi-like isoform X2 n=1 Tax=Pecten maximus TaxID=6579 RepID=UPI001458ABF4|nr:testis-specific zinc finger protein topi-like isoform X2 [Pecten maximus]
MSTFVHFLTVLRRSRGLIDWKFTSVHTRERCTVDGCGMTFTLVQNLKKHTKRKHMQRQFTCEYDGCGKSFKKNQHLKVHEFEHTKIKPFLCSYEGCGMRFLVPSKLHRHEKVHTGYKCDELGCNESFSKWTLLRKHKATQHALERKCPQCGKTFSTRQWLRQHMSVHSSERELFACPRDNCGRSYLNQRNLHAHIRSYHDGNRIECPYPDCHRRFTTEQKLKQHQDVHNPNKPPPKKRSRKTKQKNIAAVLSGVKEKDLHDVDDITTPIEDRLIDVTAITHEDKLNKDSHKAVITATQDLENRLIDDSQEGDVPATQSRLNKDSHKDGVVTPQEKLNKDSHKDGAVIPQKKLNKDSHKDGVVTPQEKLNKDSHKDGVVIPQEKLNKDSHKDGVVIPQEKLNKDSHKDGVVTPQEKLNSHSITTSQQNGQCNGQKDETFVEMRDCFVNVELGEEKGNSAEETEQSGGEIVDVSVSCKTPVPCEDTDSVLTDECSMLESDCHSKSSSDSDSGNLTSDSISLTSDQQSETHVSSTGSIDKMCTCFCDERQALEVAADDLGGEPSVLQRLCVSSSCLLETQCNCQESHKHTRHSSGRIQEKRRNEMYDL